MTTDVQILGYRQLACAIVARAVLDAKGDSEHAAPARRWLTSDSWAADLLDALDLDREAVEGWLDGLDLPRQPVLPL